MNEPSYSEAPERMQPRWGDNGLLPAIAQDAATGDVLMLAWMNEAALEATLAEGRAVYWSRSRQCLWRKGESSGNVQRLLGIALDCDGDTFLLSVEQIGGRACHTGRRHCFFYQPVDGEWRLGKESDG
ncbi:phosphoribosyl-AMP cyclohydrolase [Luminiphilus syltensis NOR5-1B]|uniref:Phosphoribosyl-AMP cyclohydrolase n=1 Tax=Luminiphilus syltensis NOR5-1B TaxID=565045 RepID=B8KUS1_9GAMM|nr:phosphoribosyl-AMP cyclohydrolase [Luminiphilus syltensis]EED35630.1 phosphoribosyl-AMP cyclohydrolase [Luminiphilus syltensis NOR5-1B]